jgi:hypothetical protein
METSDMSKKEKKPILLVLGELMMKHRKRKYGFSSYELEDIRKKPKK